MKIMAKNSVNRVALITGGAVRIGAAIVRHLHAAGYRVLIHYNQSQQSAQHLVGELNTVRPDSAHCLQADLLDLEQVSTLAQESIQQWGQVDVLINNASSFYPVPLAELSAAKWDVMLGSNAKAPLFLCHHLQHTLRHQEGSIVNIVDSTALHGLADFTPYSMAKAALANMTQALAREFAPTVRVNAISPGAILWPEYAGGISEIEKQKRLAHTALGRIGTPDDIAHAVLFLIRDASYMTGQIIAVDGGAGLGI